MNFNTTRRRFIALLSSTFALAKLERDAFAETEAVSSPGA